MFFHVRGAIVADQFSGEVFKKLLMIATSRQNQQNGMCAQSGLSLHYVL